MYKYNLQVSVVSNNAARICFGVIMTLTGFSYFYFAQQISPLLPGFLPDSIAWVHIIAIAFILAGFAILYNKQITRLASFLLAILLIGLALAIDLRGILNKGEEFRYLFTQNLFKDLGLVAGAIIIANFHREKKPSRSSSRSRRNNQYNTRENQIDSLAS